MAMRVETCAVTLQRHPPSFIEIRENVYVHRRHVSKFSLEEADVCQCRIDEGVGCTEACLNRSLFTECVSGTCPCGDACQNQRLQKRQYAKISLQYFGEKGWGVVAEEPLNMGELVVEYVGEVCDLTEVERRARHYEKLGLRNTYIMNLNSSEVIDATGVGNFSRFINHSCSPNAECQKWTVKGEQRVAIFASQEISIGEEITYNYNLDWNGGRRVKCQCGAFNCSGYLGAESVLWRKTVHTKPKKRSLFSECLSSESMEVSHEGLSSTGSYPEAVPPEMSSVSKLLPSTIMTRSKTGDEGRHSVERSPTSVGTPLVHKRRRLISDPDELFTPVKLQTPPSKALRHKKNGMGPYRAPKRRFPLFPLRPLPAKFTLGNPPSRETQRRCHHALLSVTDTVPLTELLKDPYLLWNQDHYMTLADLPLLGLMSPRDPYRLDS